MAILATKIVSSCHKTLWGEGHSAVEWGLGGSVELLLWVKSKVQSFGQWAGANCAAPPTASARSVCHFKL